MLKRIPQKFRVDLFSRINFVETYFQGFAKKPRNPQKLISAKFNLLMAFVNFRYLLNFDDGLLIKLLKLMNSFSTDNNKSTAEKH